MERVAAVVAAAAVAGGVVVINDDPKNKDSALTNNVISLRQSSKENVVSLCEKREEKLTNDRNERMALAKQRVYDAAKKIDW